MSTYNQIEIDEAPAREITIREHCKDWTFEGHTLDSVLCEAVYNRQQFVRENDVARGVLLIIEFQASKTIARHKIGSRLTELFVQEWPYGMSSRTSIQVFPIKTLP